MKSLLFSFITWFALSSIAVHAKELPPEGGDPKDFSLAKTKDFSLDNGLQVTLVPYGKTPKTTVRLLTQTGSYNDGDLLGLAELSYRLLPEGTQDKSGLEIAQLASSMGGEISSDANVNTSYVSIDVLSDFAPNAVELIAELALQAKIAEEDLERARTNRLRELNVTLSQAGSQAGMAFYKALYKDHTYANLFPSEDSLSAISTEEIRRFLQANLTAKRSHLYVAGVFDSTAVEQAIRQAFAGMPSGEVAGISAPQASTENGFIFVPREGAPQSTIRLGLPVVDPTHEDYLALQVMNDLLGGSFSSRITSNIREDKGYTYSPRSRVATRLRSALWYQSADITSESTAAALSEVLKEIDRLRSEPPSEDELDGIKQYAAGIFVLRNSSRGNIINQLWFYKNHGLERSALENYLSKLQAVSATDVSAMAKKYLRPGNMTLVVVGDEASVKPQLRKEASLKNWF